MSTRYSAPGKLFLLGEYAVLAGAPALVTAVNRRARVQVDPAGPPHRIRAEGVLPQPATWRLDGHRVRWDVADIPTLPHAVLSELSARGELGPGAAGALDLDTGEFSDAVRSLKLGLGSSAALCVALTRAVGDDSDRGQILDRALAAHRRFQGGRGSGADVAVATLGGTLAFRAGAPQPEAVRHRWPEGLRMQAIWTGRPASTPGMLEGLDRWRERDVDASNRLLERLSTLAREGIAEFAAAHLESFIQAVRDYGHLLAELGEAAGIPVVAGRHADLTELADGFPLAYKPSGAGGGDLGLALSTDAEALAAFARAAARLDCTPLELACGAPGCRRDPD